MVLSPSRSRRRGKEIHPDDFSRFLQHRMEGAALGLKMEPRVNLVTVAVWDSSLYHVFSV
jgi:hypothetical protein